MSWFRRLTPWVAFWLGLLGVVACAAAAAVVWFTGSRLSQTNDKVFDSIDKSLAAVRDRVLSTAQRVQESKITTEDLATSVKNRTREEASKRAISRLDIEAKADRLAVGLQQADLWLEMSGESIQGVQRAFEIASSLGAPVDASMVDPLAGKLGALRSQLQQSTEAVAGIRERLANLDKEKAQDERMNQVAQLAGRAVLMLGEIDSRLEESAESLTDLQTKGHQLKSKTNGYIVAAGICAVLLIAWMAAGQVSLCRHGWKDYCQYRSAA